MFENNVNTCRCRHGTCRYATIRYNCVCSEDEIDIIGDRLWRVVDTLTNVLIRIFYKDKKLAHVYYKNYAKY